MNISVNPEMTETLNSYNEMHCGVFLTIESKGLNLFTISCFIYLTNRWDIKLLKYSTANI